MKKIDFYDFTNSTNFYFYFAKRAISIFLLSVLPTLYFMHVKFQKNRQDILDFKLRSKFSRMENWYYHQGVN